MASRFIDEPTMQDVREATVLALRDFDARLEQLGAFGDPDEQGPTSVHALTGIEVEVVVAALARDQAQPSDRLAAVADVLLGHFRGYEADAKARP